MKKLSFCCIPFVASMFFFLATWSQLVYAFGPYLGRVIDKETKLPIEGAAVLAVWWERAPAEHPIITDHDAQETLTDLAGNFSIPGIIGMPINPQAKIDEPLFYIFKPGYEAYGGWRLTAKLAPPGKDGRHVVELRRLSTKEERLKNLRGISLSSRIPEQKYPNLIRLRNIEEDSLGLPPRRPRKGPQQ